MKLATLALEHAEIQFSESHLDEQLEIHIVGFWSCSMSLLVTPSGLQIDTLRANLIFETSHCCKITACLLHAESTTFAKLSASLAFFYDAGTWH